MALSETAQRETPQNNHTPKELVDNAQLWTCTLKEVKIRRVCKKKEAKVHFYTWCWENMGRVEAK